MKYLLFLALIFVATIGYAETFSTWDILELDTCASAWLIKRFVDPQAEFKFYPKGEFITEGIPFDTPDAELRRRHGISTFESIVARYKITDPAVLEIGKLIHEIEVNYWSASKNRRAEELDTAINNIIAENKNPQEVLKKAFSVMDELYENK